MENNNITSKRQNNALIVVILAVLLVSTAALGTLGYVAWKKKNAKVGIESKDNSAQINRNFNSDVVFEPSGTVVDLVKKVSPAVVTVVTKGPTQDIFTDEMSEAQKGVGTGFFVSDDGLLVTNEHVVCDALGDPKNLTVITTENKSYDVESIAVDQVQDVAILKVSTKGDKIASLKFANPESQVVVGQDVIAIGNPLGVNPGSVTRGIISGINRNIKAQGACGEQVSIKDYEGMMQTDAAINSGNSGGPLINLNGEVVAVNSATSLGANNISYSIPFDRVVRLLGKYQKNNGNLATVFIGVEHTMLDATIAHANDVPQGAYVRRVVLGSPADKGGIKKGDIITKIDDRKIDFSLRTTLNQYFEIGQKVKVEVYRFPTDISGQSTDEDGKYITLDLILEENK
jgi:S1-C subfamily serine protease